MTATATNDDPRERATDNLDERHPGRCRHKNTDAVAYNIEPSGRATMYEVCEDCGKTLGIIGREWVQ